MRNRCRSLWLSLDWWRALAETIAIQIMLLLVVFLMASDRTHPAPARTLSSFLAVIGPMCLLWCAFRMRPATVSWWRRTPLDLFCGALLSVVPYAMFVKLTSIIMPTFESQSLRTRALHWIGIAHGLIILGCVIGFTLCRIGVRVLIYWNRLRRAHLLWSLTHAHLLVVAFGAAFMATGITIIDAVLTHTIPLTILPMLVILLIFTVIALLFVLPPSALFSFLFARRITRRLRSLTEATDQLRAGVYSTRVAVSGEDEVAQLQANFNAMATDLDESVRELQSERDNVARLLAARRELIASVSHELRTPITTLRGYLESSREHWDSIDPDTLRRDLAVMERQTIHLQSLINDLFTLAQAEVGKLDMRCEPLDACPVVTRVVNTFAPLAWQRSRIEVVAEICPHAPHTMADGHRLEQVLENLVHNGVRHTPPGGIVAVRVEDGGDALIIQVKDTGEGIAGDDLPHIFERFYRSDAARANPESGGGLGLALVKELTEAMNGSVGVVSELGQGSCFTIRLPRAAEQVTASQAPRRTNPHLAGALENPTVERQSTMTSPPDETYYPYPTGLDAAVRFVGLGGHDNVIVVQSVNSMRPPRDRHLSPFGE